MIVDIILPVRAPDCLTACGYAALDMSVSEVSMALGRGIVNSLTRDIEGAIV
jgi:hypothetical protein